MLKRLVLILLLLVWVEPVLAQTVTNITSSHQPTIKYAGQGSTGSRRVVFSPIGGQMTAYAIWNPGGTTTGWYVNTSVAPYTTWTGPVQINNTNAGTVSGGPYISNIFADSPTGNLYLDYFDGAGQNQLQVFEAASSNTNPTTGYAWLASPVEISGSNNSVFGAWCTNGGTNYARFLIGYGSLYASYYSTNAASGSVPTISSRVNSITAPTSGSVTVQVVNFGTSTMFLNMGGSSSGPDLQYNIMANNVTVDGTYTTATTSLFNDSTGTLALSMSDLAACADLSGNVHVVFLLGSGSTYSGPGGSGAGWYEVIYNGTTWGNPTQITQMTYQDATPSWTVDTPGNLYLTYCHYNAANDYGIAQLTESAGTTTAFTPSTATTLHTTTASTDTTLILNSNVDFPSSGTLTVGSVTGVAYTSISGSGPTYTFHLSSQIGSVISSGATVSSLDLVTHNSTNRIGLSASAGDDANLHGLVTWVQGTSSPWSIESLTFATQGNAPLLIGQLSQTTVDSNHYGCTFGGPILNTANVSGGYPPYNYYVHRSLTGNFTPTGTTALSGTCIAVLTSNSSGVVPSYQDTTGIPGTVYHYKIKCVDSTSNSVISDQLDTASAIQEVRVMWMGASILANTGGGGQSAMMPVQFSKQLAILAPVSVYNLAQSSGYPPGTGTATLSNNFASDGVNSTYWSPAYGSNAASSGGGVATQNYIKSLVTGAHQITQVGYVIYFGGDDDVGTSASVVASNFTAIGNYLMQQGFTFIKEGFPYESNALLVNSTTDGNNVWLQQYQTYMNPVGGLFTYTTPYYPTCTVGAAGATNGAGTIPVNATLYFNQGDGSFTPPQGGTISYTGTTEDGSGNIIDFTGCTWSGVTGNLVSTNVLTSNRKVGVVAGEQNVQAILANNVSQEASSYYDGDFSVLGLQNVGYMFARDFWSKVLYPVNSNAQVFKRIVH